MSWQLTNEVWLVCVPAVCLVAVVCVSLVPSAQAWFGSASAAAVASAPHSTGVRVGAVAVAAPTGASSSTPPAAPGSVLSDTFVASPIRRGLFAATDAPAQTELAQIPFDAMFNYSSMLAPNVALPADFTDLILTAVHTGAVLDSQALLALRLLLQFQQNHEWKKSGAADKLYWDSFITELPRPSSVCFYTQSELAELQIPIESPVFAARGQQLDTITESFVAWEELLKTKPAYAALFPSGFTERWYRWAYGSVLNTAVEVPIRDEEGELGAMLVMIPLIGHINHANPPYANAALRWNYDAAAEAAAIAQAAAVPAGADGKKPVSSHGSGSLSLVALRELKAGEELFISYGSITAVPLLKHPGNATHPHADSITGHHTSRDRHSNDTSSESHFTPDSFFQQTGLSNSQLLVHYGVALPSNEYERVALDIGLDSDTVGVSEHHWDVLELKKQIIDLNELDHGTLVGLDGNLDKFFIQALRTKHLTQEDLAHLAVNEYEFSPEHGYLSLQNELKWQLQLVVSIENLLTAYPTTLQEDIAIIRELIAKEGRAAHGSNMIHAIAYRSALKRVLHALILRSLSNISGLFLNISTQWSEALHKHNLEEDAELKNHVDLTPQRKAELLAEWASEQGSWFTAMEQWKGEMDKWEATFAQWVQNAMGSKGLLAELPGHNLHGHATTDSLDELLDPSIHALQLEHDEVEVDTAEGAEGEAHHAGQEDEGEEEGDEQDAEGQHDEL